MPPRIEPAARCGQGLVRGNASEDGWSNEQHDSRSKRVAARTDQPAASRDPGRTLKNIGAFSIATPGSGRNPGILDTVLVEKKQPQEAKRKLAGTDCYRQNRSIRQTIPPRTGQKRPRAMSFFRLYTPFIRGSC